MAEKKYDRNHPPAYGEIGPDGKPAHTHVKDGPADIALVVFFGIFVVAMAMTIFWVSNTHLHQR